MLLDTVVVLEPLPPPTPPGRGFWHLRGPSGGLRRSCGALLILLEEPGGRWLFERASGTGGSSHFLSHDRNGPMTGRQDVDR